MWNTIRFVFWKILVILFFQFFYFIYFSVHSHDLKEGVHIGNISIQTIWHLMSAEWIKAWCVLCNALLLYALHIYLYPCFAREFSKQNNLINFQTALIIRKLSRSCLQNIVVIYSRRGGSKEVMHHSEWLETIDSEPDVISVFLLPLPTLLRGTKENRFLRYAIDHNENRFLRYAIDLYFRCKQLFD